jgi:hypothetical protein
LHPILLRLFVPPASRLAQLMPKACTAYAQPQPTRCDFAVSEGLY